jgi:hypothetical protein
MNIWDGHDGRGKNRRDGRGYKGKEGKIEENRTEEKKSIV